MCLLALMLSVQRDFHESYLLIHAAVYTTVNRRRPPITATEHGEYCTRAFDLPTAAANLTA